LGINLAHSQPINASVQWTLISFTQILYHNKWEYANIYFLKHLPINCGGIAAFMLKYCIWQGTQ